MIDDVLSLGISNDTTQYNETISSNDKGEDDDKQAEVDPQISLTNEQRKDIHKSRLLFTNAIS